MTTLENSPLGKATGYPDRYDPSLLFAIDRAAQREAIGIRGALPFFGADLWTAYEISWLDRSGCPRVTTAQICVPAESPAIVESKSLKLYLGSFAQEPVESIADLAQRIEADLAAICGARVVVTLTPASDVAVLRIAELDGESIDTLDVPIDVYQPAPELLELASVRADATLRSSLFRSNCPVTGQPDYADVLVRYAGPSIDRASLLRYLVSYRKHAAFHEVCVERMFTDIAARCRCERLTIYARFLRRGGIDINPFRSNFESPPQPALRTPRQ